ncbi:MAG: ABC transporter permease [candidate division Zixibacteria bacterium]|nr:ABC transporter permease [candidate division Zixibacteria bacterium]MDH3937090.1 ABC transporter permease [candidate division Zixibacteria bacterium]MDH4033850.1 ABC transporter permease [candidate division Zixibacteria bacterium]
MTTYDRLAISLGNLWRMKLRSFLTVSGVVIAIAAFVSMLSFGAGNQKLVTEQFEKLGLLSTVIVYPQRQTESNGDTSKVVLDQTVVTRLSKVPGVKLAYPLEAFGLTVQIGDSSAQTKAQTLPVAALQTKLLSQLVAGHSIESDSTDQALVTEELLEQVGIEHADSAIGLPIVLSISLSSLDSGLAHIFYDKGGKVRERLRGLRFDSLMNGEFVERLARQEFSAAAQRFFDGYMNAQETISDTLTISGVLKERRHGRTSIEPLIIPLATALKLDAGGLTADPIELISAIRRGAFLDDNNASARSYPRVTLDLEPTAAYEPVRDSVEAMGFEAFSYAEEFAEIRRIFIYFNMALAMIGLIALTTASLGIVNTMVMSIMERTREIGVLKSLGADERDIRLLFLVESGVIGLVGAGAGIVFGWLIARLASYIARTIMEREGVDPVELFAMPLWLILAALTVGVVVAVLAGLYPSGRAARVDPVTALRHE